MDVGNLLASLRVGEDALHHRLIIAAGRQDLDRKTQFARSEGSLAHSSFFERREYESSQEM